MYDIYISNLAASSRNHCLHKGITGRKSLQSMLAGTKQYKRERRAYKIIAMPQSRILVGQAVRSKRNIVLVVFASCIIGNNDRLVYLKYIGQVMLDGFKGDKYLGRGGCLASLQTVGIKLETSRVMMLRWLSGSGKEI